MSPIGLGHNLLQGRAVQSSMPGFHSLLDLLERGGGGWVARSGVAARF